MEGTRINKFLSEAGVCSRREGDRLLEKGCITIDGVVAKVGDRVFEGQEVAVNGKAVTKEEEEIFLAFYKPRGIVCTTAKEENGEKVLNVVDYINYPKRIYPVGRLDQASEGLLLMTNRGNVMEKILRSRYDHEKEYYVCVDHKIDDAFLKGMQKGVPILDTVTKPCKIWKEDDKSFHIIITQGLNRQIRRMCEYFGYQVQTLKRVRIMNLTLDGLNPGEYREIRKEEWKELEKRIRNSSSETIKETGGHHGNSSRKPNERTGKKTERSGKGLLSGRPGDHEQPGVRHVV